MRFLIALTLSLVSFASIPTSGLIAAWDLTNQSAGTQSVAGAYGTSYAIQMGFDAIADGSDPATIQANGMTLNNSGPDDQLIATTLPDTDLRGAITVIIVARLEALGTKPMITKTGTSSTNMPLAFWNDSLNQLEWRRANASAQRIFTGPTPDYGHFQMYAVTQTANMEDTPNFFVGKNKTAGVDVGGSGTGSPTTTADPLIIGTNDLGNTGLTVSHALIYNRILSDVEIGGIYDSLEFVMNGVSETLDGFGSRLMTSVSLPSPFVTSASTNSSASWNAFTFTAGDSWVGTNAGVDWIKMDIGSGKTRILNAYQIQADSIGSQAAKNWTIEGSNDDSTWFTLDSVTNQTGWTASQIRSFTCDTITTAYRYFRLNVTDNAGANVNIAELVFQEYVPLSNQPNVIGAHIAGQSYVF